MATNLKRLLQALALMVFASGSVGCGTIELPLVLALDEGAFLDLTVPAGSSAPPQTTNLDGAIETTLITDVSLGDILFLRPIVGILQADNALIAGNSIPIQGLQTGILCTILAPNGGNSSGMVTISRLFNTLTIEALVDSRIIAGNPLFRGAVPGGLPFPIEVSDTVKRFTTIDLINLVTGTGDLTISQEIDQVITITVVGSEINIGVSGELSLSTADAVPTSPNLDQCTDLLTMLGYI